MVWVASSQLKSQLGEQFEKNIVGAKRREKQLTEFQAPLFHYLWKTVPSYD